jgi:hypothetical protein
MTATNDNIVRATNVRAESGRILRVRFAGDHHDWKVDMTDLISRSVHFAPLSNDPEAFGTAIVVDDGLGVSWRVPTRWGRLDVSAETLRRIARPE